MQDPTVSRQLAGEQSELGDPNKPNGRTTCSMIMPYGPRRYEES